MLFLPVLGNRFKVADIRRGSHFAHQDGHHDLNHDHPDADRHDYESSWFMIITTVFTPGEVADIRDPLLLYQTS